MKVIDLLNKIANGEEVSKFWWYGCIHEINKDNQIYDTYCDAYKVITIDCLNDEIKLIEDNTIDIDSIEEFELAGCNVKFNDTFIPTESLINDMVLDKINELIRLAKQHDKEIKELKEKVRWK